MPSGLPHPFTRRSALLAGTVVGVAGCTVRSPLGSEPSVSSSPAPVDPDLSLRDEAAAAISAQAALVSGLVSGRVSGHARLKAFAALHARHLAALPGASPTTPVSSAPAPGLSSVLVGERALARNLAAMAQRAESGGFARLLASMSAGVWQETTR